MGASTVWCCRDGCEMSKVGNGYVTRPGLSTGNAGVSFNTIIHSNNLLIYLNQLSMVSVPRLAQYIWQGACYKKIDMQSS